MLIGVLSPGGEKEDEKRRVRERDEARIGDVEKEEGRRGGVEEEESRMRRSVKRGG